MQVRLLPGLPDIRLQFPPMQLLERTRTQSPMGRPTTDIPLPAVDLKQMVKAALWNVDYHLDVLTTLTNARGLSTLWEDDPTLDAATKNILQGEVSRFHAHLRGFFWELVAAYEAMCVWAKNPRRPELVAHLENAKQADWYLDLESYRNFAHKCFLVAEGSYRTRDGARGDVPIMLVAPRRDRMQTPVPDGLTKYKDSMQALFEKLLDLPPSSAD
jgi:hypothetical protein